MTNAFNLLDNMDGLAGTLAVIAATFFAIDAVTSTTDDLLLVVSLSLGSRSPASCRSTSGRGSRPPSSWATRGARCSGSTLAALGLADELEGGRVDGRDADPAAARARRADPRHGARHRRPPRRGPARSRQGGRDHASHRLVRSGISEKGTVVLLAAIAAGLGATSLAYSALDNSWVTLVGVLVTFALLVQFAGFLDGPRPAAKRTRWPAGALRRILLAPRRLVEVLVDFALITASFTIAYLLFIDGSGTDYQKHIFLVSLPVILAARYLCFIPAGLYSGVWRFAGAREAPRDHRRRRRLGAARRRDRLVLEPARSATSPQRIYVVDALFGIVLIGASRFGERALFRAHCDVPRPPRAGGAR